MRTIFIGTVEISWHCLEVLVDMGEDVCAIFTMPRERAATISAYKSFEDLAVRCGCPLYETASVNSDEALATMRALAPEIIYVIGWPRLVKRPLIELPDKGCFGVHTSLLPKYRGGAPVNWGLIHGETQWGITLMYLGEGADNGDIVAQAEFPISLEDTCKTVHAKSTAAALRLLRQYVPLLAEGCAPRQPQNAAEATFFPQRKPAQGIIDWNRTAMEQYNWIRALTHPYPGAFTYTPDGRALYLWSAEIPGGETLAASSAAPGTILGMAPGRGVAVATTDRPLIVTSMQPEGEAEKSPEEWVSALALAEGAYFMAAPHSKT